MDEMAQNKNDRLNIKREIQAFLGIINYLRKFSPSRAEVCDLLRQQISAKTN